MVFNNRIWRIQTAASIVPCIGFANNLDSNKWSKLQSLDRIWGYI